MGSPGEGEPPAQSARPRRLRFLYHRATLAKRVTVPACSFLDDEERAVVADALRAIEAVDAEQADELHANLDRLAHAAAIIRESPPIASLLPARISRSSFSSESLIELLCRVPDYDLDLHIPTKAVLGQAYLVAKINFFKALGYGLEGVGELGDTLSRLRFELGQSIYSKLAEELFISIVTDAHGDLPVRRAAARSLARIWDERLTTEIDDFAPFLESVWRARDRLRPVLGTMRGTHELFHLISESRDARILDYFTSDEVPLEQSQAFEEFLFGISHEEIEKLRDHMNEREVSVVSVEDAQQLLGRKPTSLMPLGGAQAFYTSYKRRRTQAAYRALTGAKGPHKTAEEYVMIAFLTRDSRDEP